MSNTLHYKGYIGSIECSEEDELLFGKVLGIRSLISYEGQTVSELVDDFHGAIDDYLAACAESGTKPETAFKGSFNIRISPELHKKIYIYSISHNMTMNHYIEETLEKSSAAQEIV